MNQYETVPVEIKLRKSRLELIPSVRLYGHLFGSPINSLRNSNGLRNVCESEIAENGLGKPKLAALPTWRFAISPASSLERESERILPAQRANVAMDR